MQEIPVISPVVDWYTQLGDAPQVMLWGIVLLLTIFLTVLFLRILRQDHTLKIIQKREKELLQMLELFPEPVAIMEETFSLVFGNRRLSNLVGWSPKELSQLKYKEYTPDKFTGEDEKQARVYTNSGQLGPYQKQFLAKSGERILVGIKGSRVMYRGKPHIMVQISDASTHEERLLDAQDQAVVDNRNRQFDFLSNMAGGVAHDLNNYMGPLVAYPDIILEQLPEDSDVRAEIQEMKVAALKATHIIRDLDALAAQPIIPDDTVDLNKAVDDYLLSPAYLEMKQRSPGVVVVVEKAPELRCIKCNYDHMVQILGNLISTSFMTMGREGTITISTATYYVEPRPGVKEEAEQEGDFAVLRIVDNGRGVNIHSSDQLFQPFFLRSHAHIRGSGLALAATYNLVRQCGGSIDVETSAGNGFNFLLQFHMSEIVPQSDLDGIGDLNGSGNILVVDDVWEQRHLAGRLLTGLGYAVKTADTGESAINYVRHHQVDLVLLDMHLEVGVDGLDVYRKMIEYRPGLPCIIVSGYATNDRVREALSLGVGDAIRKPYSLQKLGRAVQRELARAPAT